MAGGLLLHGFDIRPSNEKEYKNIELDTHDL